ncbi:uncharacterized protein LOC124463462 isoform X2 [Hypomesus transpacificus]|uniref:uncharacterized protein LOC124463460 isoform X2 n=1 Tax=Hypomesus transpacificus TaxID=137520 RepID=UPI001F08813B|nr:uncharacterized protein LOC124463460 isoform X2 [Hypomesus transpacificus]XP_046871145.1 uncharacterized protein LOC124463462 isoform X2 [Hypomesus transpacificus]
MNVKTEASLVEYASSSLFPDSPGSCTPADGTSRARGGGGFATRHQESPPCQQPAANTSAILLCPVSADRLYSFTVAEGKTILKLSPDKVTTGEFTYQSIVFLIEAVGRRWSLYGTRERSQLFQSVQKELEAQGHPLPVERIRRKWNNLIVTYKRVKDRGRETGQAKTSWEYFEMMEAMLGDTIGAQANSSTVSVTTVPMTTITAETVVPEFQPLLYPTGDILSTCTQTPTLAPTPLPPHNPSNTPPPGMTNQTDPLKSQPAAVPLSSRRALSHLSRARLHRQKLSRFSSCSFPSCSSTSCSSTSRQAQQQQRRLEESSSLLQEVLRRKEEQAGLEQGTRSEGRERRRERREVRMAESLGRIATALELLSSKQDTVIALLQRLADRK